MAPLKSASRSTSRPTVRAPAQAAPLKPKSPASKSGGSSRLGTMLGLSKAVQARLDRQRPVEAERREESRKPRPLTSQGGSGGRRGSTTTSGGAQMRDFLEPSADGRLGLRRREGPFGDVSRSGSGGRKQALSGTASGTATQDWDPQD